MQQHFLVAAATVELSPAFQSRESSRIAVLVAAATVDTDLQNQPSLPRLATDALMVPALKSRAKLTRSLPRPGKSGCIIFSNAINARYRIENDLFVPSATVESATTSECLKGFNRR